MKKIFRRNKRNKIILAIIIFILIVFIGNINIKKRIKNNFENKLKYETYNKSKFISKVDINKAKEIDLIERKINKRAIKNIFEYRESFGGFNSYNEIDDVKYVGDKTMIKIKESFIIGKDFNKKRLNINKISEKEMAKLSISKKDIEKIINFKKENGEVYSNLDLIKIIGEKKYLKIKDKVNY